MNDAFITEDILIESGIDVAGQDVAILLDELNEQLNDRVGAAIVENLDDEQMATLADMQDDDASDEAIDTWLNAHLPNFEDIVQEQVELVLSEYAGILEPGDPDEPNEPES
jgi:Protein of unknown function (DUF5663)